MLELVGHRTKVAVKLELQTVVEALACNPAVIEASVCVLLLLSLRLLGSIDDPLFVLSFGVQIVSVICEVVPLVALSCQLTFDELLVQVLDSDRRREVARSLKGIDIGKLFRANVVHRRDRLAPATIVVRQRMWLFAIDGWPLNSN